MSNSDEIIIDASSASENDRPSLRHATNRFRNRSPPPHYSVDDPHPFPTANRTKELFPSATGTKSGQLASDNLQKQKLADRAAAAAKLKKELFPNKTDRSNHRRSDAFDARAATDAKTWDDLSSRMSRRMDLADTKLPPINHNGNANAGKELFSSSFNANPGGGARALAGPGGVNIKGSAGLSIKGAAGMSIKGAATNVRELFPDRFTRASGNEGKELFSDKIKGRGSLRRNKAEDLFG